MESLTILGLVTIAVIAITAVLLVITRRTHLRSWRFGLFYESQDRIFKEGSHELPPPLPPVENEKEE